MKFFEELRKGVANIVTNIKKNMAAKAVENKEIKAIEQEAAFKERKKQAVKTAKFRVQLKGKKDRELIKNPNKNAFGTGTQQGNIFDMPQTKQSKAKKKKEIQQDLINPNVAMDMVNYNPFKTK